MGKNPAALASVSYGKVLVRVRTRRKPNVRALLAQVKCLSSSGPTSSWAEETTTTTPLRGVHGLFTKPVAAPWALKCLKVRSLGRAFSSVSDSHTGFSMNPRETIEARKARSGLWRWCTRVLWFRILFFLGCWSGVPPPNHVSSVQWQARWSPVSSSMAPPAQVARGR
jgi:hypothetical protein